MQVRGSDFDRRDFGYLQSVYRCWLKNHKEPIPETGCTYYFTDKAHPDQIQRELTRCRRVRVVKDSFRWYDHGFVNLKGNWTIDKERLRLMYENEIEKSRAYLCPLFNKDAVLALIDNLPGSVDYKAYEIFKRNGDLRILFPTGDSRFAPELNLDAAVMPESEPPVLEKVITFPIWQRKGSKNSKKK